MNANGKLTEDVLFERFCYLGSFEAVCVHKREKEVNVEFYFPKLKEVCEKLDDTIVLHLLKLVLVGKKLVRRDEPLFAYATYLSSDVDIKFKTKIRSAIAELVISDEDLFTFVKYAFLIQNLSGKKILSTTHRKAILCWYNEQTTEALYEMWFHHRKYRGFTHKALIKLCNVIDSKSRSYKIFFKSSAEIIKDAAKCNKKDLYPEKVMQMTKLRTTFDPNTAADIIKQANFTYNNIPQPFLKYTEVVQVLLKSMPYLELLKYWVEQNRDRVVQNEFLKICKQLLEDKEVMHQNDIHPIVLLIELDKLSMLKNQDKQQENKDDFIKTNFLKRIYIKSFGANQATGLRIHITISLNKLNRSRKIKYLRNLTEYDAAIAIAFGFFKTERDVDVWYYGENHAKLEKLRWTQDMDIDNALKMCRKIKRIKAKQRLIAPVMQSLHLGANYDLFLVIVPTGAYSNPHNSSDLLRKCLNSYRRQCNERAKFVLLDLHSTKKSMEYSNVLVENILEVCGVNVHSIDVINNFALNRFY